MFELGKEHGWTFCELVDASAMIAHSCSIDSVFA